MVTKMAEKLGGALVPPGIDPTTMWRLAVSGTLGFLVIAFFWSVGTFASFGMPGFARADQQQQIIDALRAQKVERLEASILQSQRDYCKSPQDSKPREFYLGQRNMKLNEYVTLTGQPYQGMPNCDEL